MSATPTDSVSEDDSWLKWFTGGWAKGVVVVAFLIIAFYLEEDWQGATAWTDAKAEIAAEEEPDPSRLIPPPVPDAENFAALPIFQLAPDPGGYPWARIPTAMNNALASVKLRMPYSKDDAREAGKLPYEGNWQRGEKTDLPAISKRMAEVFHHLLPSTPIPPNATSAEMLDLLCPALSDLRTAAATYPYCRFNLDYAQRPASDIPLSGMTSEIGLARVLGYEEQLALIDNQPGLAVADMKVEWKINSGLQKEPILVSGLVSSGVVAIQLGVVREGLALHEWTDPDLATLDADLGKIDFLATDQLCFRGEATLVALNEFDYSKEHRIEAQRRIFEVSPSRPAPNNWGYFVSSCIFELIPDGWFDQFKADNIRLDLKAVPIVDPVNHRVFPEKWERLQTDITKSRSARFGNFFSSEMEGLLNSIKNFAYAQVQVDQARIACRLERYRLVHGVYPASLNALVPAYGADLPQDVIKGAPYHYKLQSDGTYLLYSVGWDQIDDGGLGPDSSQSSRDAPDWVWLNHPEAKKAK